MKQILLTICFVLLLFPLLACGAEQMTDAGTTALSEAEITPVHRDKPIVRLPRKDRATTPQNTVVSTVYEKRQQQPKSEKMVKAKRQRYLASIRYPRYQSYIDAGWGVTYHGGLHDLQIMGFINYIGGIRFNNYNYLGLGIGCDIITPRADWEPGFAMFLNYRAFMTKTIVKPYFSLSAGMTANSYGLGLLLNPSLGLSFRLYRSFDFYLSLSYRYELGECYSYPHTHTPILNFGFQI